MKFTFLGTAAAEGFPAIFCNCEHCQKARKLGEKNIRTRSQSIINEDLLIDLSADTYMHFLQNNISGHKIKYLFVTHSHQDHFYIDEFKMRHGAFAHDMEEPVLNVYCSEGAYKKYQITDKAYGGIEGVKVNLVRPYERIFAGEYEIIPLPAKHAPGDGAVFYIIKYQDKTLLYAHDTGYFYEEVFEYLKNNKIKFDFITFDCTSVGLDFGIDDHHMGINSINKVVERLKCFGTVNSNTTIYLNHFSHNGNPLQENIEKLAQPFGYKVAFDGLKVEI